MNNNLKNIFTEIYKTNKWGGKESRSGPGSDVGMSGEIAELLDHAYTVFDIWTILDIPCGDMNWVNYAFDKVFPAGVIHADIVPELIEANRAKYPDVDFRVLDITTDELPQVDLVFTRDLFGHLSHENTMKALNNIKRSGSRYLLTTSFTGRTDNKMNECGYLRPQNGGWYPINVCIHPFNLQPIYLIHEDCQEYNGAYNDKCLVLIDIAKMPNYEI